MPSAMTSPFPPPPPIPRRPPRPNLPLSARILTHEDVKGLLGTKHTEYTIEVDAFGKGFNLHKRFRNFVKLHDKLRQSGIPQLPDLPPKKVFGKMKHDFVEKRQKLLQTYLQRLLRVEDVLNNDKFWAFIGADSFTMAVARFVCSKTRVPLVDRLLDVKRVAVNPVHVNRLCHAPVVEALLQAGRTGSVEEQTLVCQILTALVRKEGGRRYLIEGGSIALVTSMIETACKDGEQPPQPLVVASTTFLKTLVESSPGSLLVFFRTGGLAQFRGVLRDPKTAVVHGALGQVLWLALGLPEVQAALAEQDGIGMEILEALYQSPQIDARLCCGVVLATLLKQNRFLQQDTANSAAMSLELLPETLHNHPGLNYNTVREICSPRGLARIASLLKDPPSVPAITLFVCWLLTVLVTHPCKPARGSLTQRSTLNGEAAALLSSQGLIQPLEQLLKSTQTEGEHGEGEGEGESALPPKTRRMVAALVATLLLYLPWSASGEPSSPLPPLMRHQSAASTSLRPLEDPSHLFRSPQVPRAPRLPALRADALARSAASSSDYSDEMSSHLTIRPPSFLLPVSTLEERLGISRVLLSHCEKEQEGHRDLLRSEHEKLAEREGWVKERTDSLEMGSGKVRELLRDGMEAYQMGRESLADASQHTRAVLTRLRTMLEANVLTKGSLTVNANDFAAEIARLRDDAAHVNQAHSDALAKATSLDSLKAEADSLLKQLTQACQAVRQTNETLRIVKRTSTAAREKWMEAEQSIQDAPRRRTQLQAQLAYQQQQTHQLEARLHELTNAKEEASEILAQKDSDRATVESVLSAIRRVRHDFDEWRGTFSPSTRRSSRSRSGGTGDRDSLASPTHVPSHASSSNGSNGQQETAPDSDAATDSDKVAYRLAWYARQLPVAVADESVQDFISVDPTAAPSPSAHSEAAERFSVLLQTKEEHLLARRDALTSDDSSHRVRQLAEKIKRISAELQRGQKEVQTIEAQLAMVSDANRLADRAATLQAECRRADAEVAKVGEEAARLESHQRAIEGQLEHKKEEMRRAEADLKAAADNLTHLIDKSITLRRQLARRCHTQEGELAVLLNETELLNVQRDRLANDMKALDACLLKERQQRSGMRVSIQSLMVSLERVDGALKGIDDGVLADVNVDTQQETHTKGGLMKVRWDDGSSSISAAHDTH